MDLYPFKYRIMKDECGRFGCLVEYTPENNKMKTRILHIQLPENLNEIPTEEAASTIRNIIIENAPYQEWKQDIADKCYSLTIALETQKSPDPVDLEEIESVLQTEEN